MPSMDTSTILNHLNPEQQAAVTAPLGHLLVLAGAGSGKTRVLTRRIAWLIREQQASPWAILAVTFTNKAAAEMRNRVSTLLERPATGLWIGTFHGIAHRLLRQHHQAAGLAPGFQVLDSADQIRLVKRVLRDLNIDDKRYPPAAVANFINRCKDEAQRPNQLGAAESAAQRQYQLAYARYHHECQRSSLVDFGELLLRTYEMWQQQPTLLAQHQQRFRHLLVDEFQDTNAIQYAWVRQLGTAQHDLLAVGDDDQCIYGFRGSKVENLQRFQHDFPHAQLIRLEQNYRSSGSILQAANALIANNTARLGKTLWTAAGMGEPLQLHQAQSAYAEARFVVGRIRAWVNGGGQYRDAAILYRSNAQSRLFEEAMIALAIPYQIYGGLRFFERAEIKDALAYLRLIANRNDDPSFERVVNLPARGIGSRTMELLRHTAQASNCSLYQATQHLLTTQQLSGRAANALRSFLRLLDTLQRDGADLALPEQIAQVVIGSGLQSMYEQSKDELRELRVENLEELVNAAASFISDSNALLLDTPPTTTDWLHAFLAQASLEAGERQSGEGNDCVQMMTLHSAKGLEFPLVFLVGWEEGLFPHNRSSNDPQQLEEERRLAYVGITRAQQRLYLCHAQLRQLYGSEQRTVPSRFLAEIPSTLIQGDLQSAARSGFAPSLPSATPSTIQTAATHGLRPKQLVRHRKFGEGIVLEVSGNGHQARAQVAFAAGHKWLLLAIANLELL